MPIEDFGYEKHKEASKVSSIIKRAVLIGAVIFSISCFIYITISAYHFVYHDQNNDVALIKSPPYPIKIIEEGSDGMPIKDMDKTIYENIVGNKRESLALDTINVIRLPEQPQPAKKIAEPDISRSPLTVNEQKDRELIQYKEVDNSQANSQANPQKGKLLITSNTGNQNQVLEEQKSEVKKPAKPIRPASRVQLAAMNSNAAADEYWGRLKNKYPKLFSGLKYYVQEVKLGQKGTFYRLQIGDFENQIEAENFCVKFIAQAQKTRSDCIVVE